MTFVVLAYAPLVSIYYCLYRISKICVKQIKENTQ